MALKKLITDPKGQKTEYHRVLIASQVYVDGKECIQINLAGYTSKAFRDAEKADNTERIVNCIPITLITTDDDFSRATLYQRIKSEILEFEDAEDV
jgi:hypothetical protein